MRPRTLPIVASLAGLRIGALLAVSFQRFATPACGIIDDLPRSLGALPVAAAGDGTLLVPLADDEAFWIGVSTLHPGARAEISASALLADGRVRAEATILVTGASRLPGMPREDGRFDAFTRAATPASPGVRAVTLRCRIGRRGGRALARVAAATVWLADPMTFRIRTGHSPLSPLDAEAGYGGWRLP
jgi:hypothetical protein